MYQYRVFISYGTEDYQTIQQIINILKNLNLTPLWDNNIALGTLFTDMIKDLISQSHFIMPVMTKTSKEKPWIHQEIGYALALNIPVIPLTINCEPTEFIAQFQAISVNHMDELPEKLNSLRLLNLSTSKRIVPPDRIQIALWPQERTRYIGDFAKRLSDNGKFDMIRQQAIFTSFSIPSDNINNKIWKIRDGTDKRSKYYHSLQREERIQLEKHVIKAGCKLILHPSFELTNRGKKSTVSHLETLKKFIKTQIEEENDKVKMVTSPRPMKENILIIGDWFYSTSINPGLGGYEQTIFNWKPLEVIEQIKTFDQKYDEICESKGIQESDALESVIEEIDNAIANLQTE